MKSSSRRLLLIWVKRNRLKHEGYFGISLSAQTGAAATNRYYSVVCPADFAEGSGTASQAQEVALYNAAGKCAAVAAKMGDELPIIAADTIVVIDNVILGKPQDAAAAKAMLQCLSGRTHQVITGVAVRYKDSSCPRCALLT